MQTIDFLRAVLPEDSIYFSAVPSSTGKGFSHTACKSPEELAHRITHIETSSTANVYFACAGYREEFIERPVHGKAGTEMRRQYRTKENVKRVKAFWLDLDVGESKTGVKKYATQGEAVLGLAKFLRDADLPKPMVISSGYGIHVYWPLTTSLFPGQWRATALQLKALCTGLGLLADPSRTSDEASVLRPVGTSNRKAATAKPVFAISPREGEAIPMVDHAVFHAALITALSANKLDVVDTDKSDKLKVNPTDMIVPVGGFQKVSATLVAEKCQQVRLFRETGGVSEPHWYHSLQIMRHTVEGEAKAHEWSKVHAEYSEPETEVKLAQVREMGPTLCAKFKDINPDGCKDCPFAGKISTPVQLGIVVQAAPPPMIHETVDGEKRQVTLPDPPWPFKRGADDQPGLYIEVDQGTPVKFYPYDLFPVAIVNDEGKRESSMVVKHWLPQEGWREFPIPLALLASPRDLVGKMHNNFVHPINPQYMVTYMDAYIKELQDQLKIKRLHGHFGWLEDNSFLLGTKLYTPAGTHEAGVSTAVSEEITDGYHTKGTHEGWQDAIRRFDREGLESHLFSILTGFAAPLFRLTGFGAIVVSMMGETNAGKTLSARAMMNIYGDFGPFEGGKNDTVNARIEKLGMLRNLPMYIDENTNIASDQVSEFMHQINQGKGRARLRSDASMKDAAKWNTIVLTSSNKSLVGRLLEAKLDPEAEMMRVFEYTVPKHEWFETEMPAIYDALAKNYGHAGEQYIRYLVRLPAEDVERGIKETGEAFAKTVGFRGKERFWYGLAGTVLYSMALAKASGALTFEDFGATFRRIHTWCRQQIEHQRIMVDGAHVTPVEGLAMFLNDSLPERIVIMENATGLGDVLILKHPATHAKLKVEYNQTSGIIYIDQKAMRTWLMKNQFNAETVKDILMNEHIVMRSGAKSRHTLGKGTQYRGGQVRVWMVNAKHPALDGIAAVLERDHVEVEAPA